MMFDNPPRIEWRHEQDGEWEYRFEVVAVVECDRCGKDVDLEAETDGWTEEEEGSGRFVHDSYGPALGVCCGLLYADWWEGTFAYVLPNGEAAAS